MTARNAFYERTAAKDDEIRPIFLFRTNVFVSNIYDGRRPMRRMNAASLVASRLLEMAAE